MKSHHHRRRRFLWVHNSQRHCSTTVKLTGPSGGQEPIEEIMLIDARLRVCRRTTPRVQQIVGDISNRDVIDEAIGNSQ